ncbi:hypothetical protein ABZP36_008275 [Zizania latifolia]
MCEIGGWCLQPFSPLHHRWTLGSVEQWFTELRILSGDAETQAMDYSWEGIKMDGSSSHFFRRISNAYGSGQRKRRKISHDNHTVSNDNIRWHKTGRSREICRNGVKKGWKKILVLHSRKGGVKIKQAHWVMHQYNLGVEEEEKHGELVLSKVFCQLVSKQTDTPEVDSANGASDAFTVTEQNVAISHDQVHPFSRSTALDYFAILRACDIAVIYAGGGVVRHIRPSSQGR